MGLLRSETMKHGTVVIPTQDARKYIDAMGQKTTIQFEDLNAKEMRRPYRQHTQRLDEMERILRFLTAEINLLPDCDVQKHKIEEFMAAEQQFNLDPIEKELKNKYDSIVKCKAGNAQVIERYNEAREEFEVASLAISVHAMAKGPAGAGINQPLLAVEDAQNFRSLIISGMVAKDLEGRLRKRIWVASRGNVLMDCAPDAVRLTDPKTGQEIDKVVFYVYMHDSGESKQTNYLHEKVIKVCQGFGANMYNWPQTLSQANEVKKRLDTTLKDRANTRKAADNYMRSELEDMLSLTSPGCNSKLEDYRLFCVKEKSIYHVLNLCEEGKFDCRANIWYPAACQQDIEKVLSEVKSTSQPATLIPDRALHGRPPTYIRTNEFTEPWQEVINTYGFPRYQEANPALLAMVTFPFIFGMMYGDVGHGSMLLLVGVWLIMNAEKHKYTQPALYKARYMVFQLGFFATYAGVLYNDFFSVGLRLFGESAWEDSGDGSGNYVPKPGYDITNSGNGKGPYPVGLDPSWAGAQNELLFQNSMKMKLSVLFGVGQMTLGVFLKFGNAIYEKNMVDLFCECIPMLVFMLCFFGWMDFMVLFKWVNPVNDPPSIINSLICMAMGQEDHNPLWDGSVQLAQTLMKFTVITVPWMLFPKPFILLKQHQAKEARKAAGLDIEAVEDHGGHGHGEEFEFGEVFIHQIIETIEYVLGTVSHTASYLRIWALSLAHQQLSLVFFQKTLQMGLEWEGPAKGIMLYFMFAAWFGITLGVLLGMDVLECFLHTLRLHWVEFQSKFYKADGEPFDPFDIRKLVAESEEQ